MCDTGNFSAKFGLHEHVSFRAISMNGTDDDTDTNTDKLSDQSILDPLQGGPPKVSQVNRSRRVFELFRWTGQTTTYH